MVKLRDYQLSAIDSLRTGSILCGGVGSGKSRTALAYWQKAHPDKDLYIITTARKRDTNEWEDELAAFKKKAVKIDSWNNIKKYIDVKNSFFIFDEQRVVGYGVWSKSFIKIARTNDWILLSATPGDSWIDYAPVFIANGFYKNITDFKDEHVVWKPYSKFPQIKGYVNQGLLIKHRNDILVNMDYDRPTESHHENVLVEYDKSLYQMIFRNRWNIYEDEPIQNVSECCYLLRKVVNSDETRMDAVWQILDRHPKAIIFYKYNFELDIMREELTKRAYPFSEWNGQRHEEIVGGDRWVYLVQYTSGSEGWNCIETDTMIFYSDDYSYKVMVQAAGRIDRMNTPFKDLYYYHLRSVAPIDRAIALALKKKKNFNESKFVGGL